MPLSSAKKVFVPKDLCRFEIKVNDLIFELLSAIHFVRWQTSGMTDRLAHPVYALTLKGASVDRITLCPAFLMPHKRRPE
jgi:hypothetical protein